jgi:hypothetical protein
MMVRSSVLTPGDRKWLVNSGDPCCRSSILGRQKLTEGGGMAAVLTKKKKVVEHEGGATD